MPREIKRLNKGTLSDLNKLKDIAADPAGTVKVEVDFGDTDENGNRKTIHIPITERGEMVEVAPGVYARSHTVGDLRSRANAQRADLAMEALADNLEAKAAGGRASTGNSGWVDENRKALATALLHRLGEKMNGKPKHKPAAAYRLAIRDVAKKLGQSVTDEDIEIHATNIRVNGGGWLADIRRKAGQ